MWGHSAVPHSVARSHQIMDPNWIVAISALAYTGITAWLILDQRESRLDDKFPCVSVRSRKNSDTEDDEIRLVNVGRGPAFITKFLVEGLHKISPTKKQGKIIHDDKGEIIYHDYPDGDYTGKIDKVLGPEIGNPDLQCWFAWGTPEDLRSKKVTITIHYRDLAGRLFESGIDKGEPYYKPPWQHKVAENEKRSPEVSSSP